MEFLSSAFFSALFAIVIIDLVLAGDNAVVIALAARNLPRDLQKRAVIWGAVGAVMVRSVMTLGVVWLLGVPGLRFVGGLLLLWIGYKLLVPTQSGSHQNVAATTGFGLLATKATEYVGNPFLYVKFPSILLGLLNVFLLHRTDAWKAHVSRDLSAREQSQLARFAGMSLLCWLTAISAGRMVGYW